MSLSNLTTEQQLYAQDAFFQLTVSSVAPLLLFESFIAGMSFSHWPYGSSNIWHTKVHYAPTFLWDLILFGTPSLTTVDTEAVDLLLEHRIKLRHAGRARIIFAIWMVYAMIIIHWALSLSQLEDIITEKFVFPPAL